jgi:hypothetical protein
MSLFGKNKLKEWAEANNLNYTKEIKLGFIRSENVSVVDAICGEYRNNRIYIFTIIDNTGSFSQSRMYLNNNCYVKIEPVNIDQLLIDKNFLEIIDLDGNETETEVIQGLISQVYLKTGSEVDYKVAKEIHKLLLKYYSSRTNLKDKIIGGVLGSIRSDIKFNSPEAIEFVLSKNKNIERKIVENIANAYEDFLVAYNNEVPRSNNPLENIDLSKFE